MENGTSASNNKQKKKKTRWDERLLDILTTITRAGVQVKGRKS